MKRELTGSIHDIFETEVNGTLPPRIVLLGAAGYGKTTAMAKLAHDWAVEGDLPLRRRFPLLFWLKFRETKKDSSLGELIMVQLLQQLKGVSREELETFLDLYGGQCGIILDGLDEFSGNIASNESSTSLVELINYRRFPECRVLVSTRPHLGSHFETEELSKVYAVMKIEGFAEEDAELYINKFFSSDASKGHRLSEYLKTQFNLASIIRIPFFCMVICLLWDGDYLNNVNTLSNVFEQLMQYLAMHARERQSQLTSLKGELVDVSEQGLRFVSEAIGKVAFTVLIQDSKRLILSKKEFDQEGCTKEFDMSVNLGIIHSFDKESDHKGSTVTCCEFYHKLAQEYCAGVYLSVLPRKELKRKLNTLIDSEDKVVEFENVLRFAAESGMHTSEVVLKCIMKYPPGVNTTRILNTLFLDILSTVSIREESSSAKFLRAVSSRGKRNLPDLLQSYFSEGQVHMQVRHEGTILGLENLPHDVTEKLRHWVLA